MNERKTELLKKGMIGSFVVLGMAILYIVLNLLTFIHMELYSHVYADDPVFEAILARRFNALFRFLFYSFYAMVGLCVAYLVIEIKRTFFKHIKINVVNERKEKAGEGQELKT